MLTIVIVGFIASFIASYLYKPLKNYFGWIAVTFPLYMFFSFLFKYPDIAAGKIIHETTEWIPFLGINLSFLVDGLSLTFVLIITLVGAAVFLYAGTYMKDYQQTNRFYVYIGLFMTSMIGLVTSDNMITLFIFWELTSVSSYLLIGFNHHKENSRKFALQALLVTGFGSLSLLAGFILLFQISGNFEISSLNYSNDIIINSGFYPAIVILILLGAFTKSAQFPFHFWLPNAMEAPTPVSAYLHSATMVKAGIYLIARLNQALGGTDLWQNTIILIGTLTMLFSAIMSFNQNDLKKLLAYSTLSVLGTLTLLLGIGSKMAIKAFFIYLIAHSLYKGTLFLIAGIIDHHAGTRDVSKLGGLRKFMPISTFVAIFASLSMMGIIPLVGFIGKETVYSSILEVENWGLTLILIAIIANALIVMITIYVGVKPFWSNKIPDLKIPHEAHIKMLLGPIVMAVLGLLVGIYPNFFMGKLLEQSSLSILSEKLIVKIKLWQGFNLVLLLSFLTLALGISLYTLREKYNYLTQNVKLIQILKPSQWYEYFINGMLIFAKFQTKILQNGYLRNYIIFIISSVIVLSFYILYNAKLRIYLPFDYSITIYEFAISIVIIIAAFTVVFSISRLKSIIALGVVGFIIGIYYIIFSAPDLALTTIAIETLTVILFVLVLYKLPRFLKFSNLSTKFRDTLISASVGIFITLMILYVNSYEISNELKNFYAQKSFIEGQGRNIVNVILVDFRALDTLGEITVLGIAALGVYALLKLRLDDRGE